MGDGERDEDRTSTSGRVSAAIMGWCRLYLGATQAVAVPRSASCSCQIEKYLNRTISMSLSPARRSLGAQNDRTRSSSSQWTPGALCCKTVATYGRKHHAHPTLFIGHISAHRTRPATEFITVLGRPVGDAITKVQEAIETISTIYEQTKAVGLVGPVWYVR